MKTLIQSEKLLALVFCGLGEGRLSAFHTFCSHILNYSAALVGKLGICTGLSHHLCTYHLNGKEEVEVESNEIRIGSLYTCTEANLHNPCF